VIDLIHVVLDVEHVPFGPEYSYTPERSLLMGETGNVKKDEKDIRFAGGFSEVKIKSLNDGSKISIRTSPLSPFQGHNVVGSSVAWILMLNTIECVLDNLGITLTKSERKAIDAGKFEIQELHITERIKVDNHSDLKRIFHHLLKHFPSENKGKWAEKGLGIIFTNPKTGVVHYLYDKLLEISDRRTMTERRLKKMFRNVKHQDEAHKLLCELAKGSIRYEQKYSAEVLKKLGLNTGAAWRDDAEDTGECMALLQFKNEQRKMLYPSLPSIEKEEIFSSIGDWKDASLIALWMLGIDPKEKRMDPKTFNTASARIQKNYRLDISKPYRAWEGEEIRIKTIFSTKNIDLSEFNPPRHLSLLLSDGADLVKKIREKSRVKK